MEAAVIYNVVSEERYHHFHHIPWVSRASLSGPGPEIQDGGEDHSRVGDRGPSTGVSWRPAASVSFRFPSKPSDGSF